MQAQTPWSGWSRPGHGHPVSSDQNKAYSSGDYFSWSNLLYKPMIGNHLLNTAVGTFLSTLIFAFFTAMVHHAVVDICVLNDAGTCQTAPCFCETLVTDNGGSYPVFSATSLIALAIGVGALRVLSNHIMGAISTGDVSFEQRLSRFITSFWTKSEPRDFTHLVAYVIFSFGGNFLGIAFAAWLTTFNPYGAENTSLGVYQKTGNSLSAPHLSLNGTLLDFSKVVGMVIINAFVLDLMALWLHLENQWGYTQALGHKTATKTEIRGVTLKNMTPLFLSHHSRSMALGVVQAALILTFGHWIGFTGYFTRDLAALVIATAKGDPTDRQFGLFIGYRWIGTIIANIFFFIMTWTIGVGNQATVYAEEATTLQQEGGGMYLMPTATAVPPQQPLGKVVKKNQAV